MNQLPIGWTTTKIGEITIPFQSDNPGRDPDRLISYVDIGSIDNATQKISEPKILLGRDAPSRARRLIKTGDVLFATVRTYLKNIAVVPTHLDGAFTSTGIAVLRPSSAVDTDYLFHWVCSAAFLETISKAQDGTMYPAVSDGDVAASFIDLPPLAEQKRIVAKLNTLTACTAQARADLDRVPSLAARYKQALLARHFTTGDPNELVELGSVVTLINGDRGKAYPNDSEQTDSGYCLFLGTRNVLHGRFDWNNAKYITKEKHDQLSGGLVEHGDIVLTIRGTLGNCAVFDENAPFKLVRINSAMIIVRPNRKVLPTYVMWALRAPAFLGWVGASARGSAQPHLRASDIKSTTIRLPSQQEQQRIVNQIEAAFAEIDRLTKEAAAACHLLDRLDQTILSKAFRGELVEQDAADEPASVLLERIKADRANGPAGARRGRPAKVS